MNTKHTPGPWNVGSADGFNACTIFQEGPKHEQNSICSVYGIPMNTRVDEVGIKWAQGMANARLIAAAPELLEILEEYALGYSDTDLETLANTHSGRGEIGAGTARREIRRRAAIAKATGKEGA